MCRKSDHLPEGQLDVSAPIKISDRQPQSKGGRFGYRKYHMSAKRADHSDGIFYAESTLEGVGFWVEVAESLRHVSSFFVPPRPRPFFLFLLLVSVRQCEALSGNSINVRPSITPAESVAVKQKTFPTQSQAAEKETTNDRFDR